MFDTIPFVNQPYNDSIFKITVHKLIDQEPGIISWTLDNIIYKLYDRSTPAYFKDLLPLPRMTLKNNMTTIRLPKEKKVTYFWICQKLLQLLLWTEDSPAKNSDYFIDLYKIRFEEININAQKIQEIMSDYANLLASKPVLVRPDQPLYAESSVLPSYQNVISNQGSVGTSNFHSSTRAQQAGNFSETNGHTSQNIASNTSSRFKLPYCFDGSDKLKARSFIDDYNCLALRNRWSSEEKYELFSNHLEKEALEWYLSDSISSLTSWQALKIEFMRKYCI